MKLDAVRDLENLYGQTMRFLESEGTAEGPPVPGPNRTEYETNFRAVPEKYLLKDNLLLLLKEL
jgi:hypothetical protein